MSSPTSPRTTPERVYLDYNATTPLHSRVREALVEALSCFGNPSSIHSEGRAARACLEEARREVAGLLQVSPTDLVFTSGGTEANALGLRTLYEAARAEGRGPTIAVLATDHPSVHGAADALRAGGADVATIPVTADGHVDMAALDACLHAGNVAVVAMALANHELGTVVDWPAVAARCRAAGALCFADAVQALGKLPVNVMELGVDALAVSAHKIYGPKGIGALWLRAGLSVAPLAGGHQERGRRPGTENLLGAIGFGVACAVVGQEGGAARERMVDLSQRLEAGILAVPGSRIHGGGRRVPGTINAGFSGARGEVVVQALDLLGVQVSAGAACTSGSSKPSPVILALGFPPERAAEAVRFSLGYSTTVSEIERALAHLPVVVERARSFPPGTTF